MENASKALIIAGAILISILLISVGIMVFNSINQPLEEAKGQGSSQAAQIFNSRFTKYEGRQSAANARTLIQEINASNAVNDRQVHLFGQGSTNKAESFPEGKDGSVGAGSYTTTVNSSKYYNVTIAYGTKPSDKGYITEVLIVTDDTKVVSKPKDGDPQDGDPQDD
jgi:hypothetical protein